MASAFTHCTIPPAFVFRVFDIEVKWCFSKCSCKVLFSKCTVLAIFLGRIGDQIFVLSESLTLGLYLASCPFYLFWALRLNVLSCLLLCQQIGQSYSVRISDKTVQHRNSRAISVEAWPHWCVSRVWWLPSQEMLTLPADELNVMNSSGCLK